MEKTIRLRTIQILSGAILAAFVGLQDVGATSHKNGRPVSTGNHQSSVEGGTGGAIGGDQIYTFSSPNGQACVASGSQLIEAYQKALEAGLIEARDPVLSNPGSSITSGD